MLQWSRNFRVAESTTTGAVVNPGTALQWSRNFRVAESTPTRTGRRQSRHASMEPQL